MNVSKLSKVLRERRPFSQWGEREMPIQAYVFIRVLKGNANAVLRGVSRIKGVKSARIVTGRYDVVAFVEAESLEEIGKLVASKIHRVRGVLSTETAVVTT